MIGLKPMIQLNLGAMNTDGSGADRQMPGSQPSGGGSGYPLPSVSGRTSPYAGTYVFNSVYQTPPSLPQPLPAPTMPPPLPASVPMDMPVAGTNVTVPAGQVVYGDQQYAMVDPNASIKRWLMIGLGVGLLAGVILFFARR